MIGLQALATAYVWTQGAISLADETKLATFLGVDLLAFAAVAYVYGRRRLGEATSRAWLLLVTLTMAALLISTLVF
jgi:hypothetical protein